MVSITERTTQKGEKRFQVIVRTPGAPSVTRTFESRKKCEEFGVNAQRSMKLQFPPKRKSTALSLADFDGETVAHTLRDFLASKSATVNNRKVGATVLKHVGSAKQGQATAAWVERFIEHMRSQKTSVGKQFTWDTIWKQIGVMNKARRWRARMEGLPIERLPFDIKTMFPRNWETRRERRLDRAEEVALMSRLKGMRDRGSRNFWRLLIQFALETAARQQEFLLAEWSHVSFERCTWRIPHTKTGKPRTVPLSKRSLRILRILFKLRDPESPRIFNQLGSPASVSALFHRYSKQAGLVDFRFHDLRHEAITRLVLHKRKLSVFEIMAMVGHSSLEMLHRYANLRGEELAARLD